MGDQRDEHKIGATCSTGGHANAKNVIGAQNAVAEQRVRVHTRQHDVQNHCSFTRPHPEEDRPQQKSERGKRNRKYSVLDQFDETSRPDEQRPIVVRRRVRVAFVDAPEKVHLRVDALVVCHQNHVLGQPLNRERI